MAAGSTPKGEARRTALLDGMLRVLEREGPGAVTHRSVAAEAGVPVAAATYYFASLDELFLAGLRKSTMEQLDLFAPMARGDLRAMAESLHSWIHLDRPAAIAQYELVFLAMRRDGLRHDAITWYDTLEAAVAEQVPAASVRLATLALDGLMLRMLWRGDPATVDDIESSLADILAIQRPG